MRRLQGDLDGSADRRQEGLSHVASNRGQMAARDVKIKTLGLRAKNRIELAKKIHRGMPYKSVEKFRAATHLPEARLQSVTGIPARTWTRRKKGGKFNPEESERIARIARIFEQAERVLGTKDSATKWLQEPNLGLGNEAPIEIASMELGAKEVEELLSRIEYGVYS